uniref:Uncharacterized protein n=1 Tax=Rangifer tarandus platyrhynchus TaxID=3082113 RepID=A0ACB0EG44_RANTA|nr:unnamed protein product [Rangifer tarandus platyrhynchus]
MFARAGRRGRCVTYREASICGILPQVAPPAGLEKQPEPTRGTRRTGMADQGETRKGKRLQTPCAPRGALHGSPGGRRAPGSGLCSAVPMPRPASVRVLRLRRLLWRRRGLQLRRRRRPSGASPTPDSQSSGPPPPANSWPGSRDRGAHPPCRRRRRRLLPHTLAPDRAAPHPPWA